MLGTYTLIVYNDVVSVMFVARFWAEWFASIDNYQYQGGGVYWFPLDFSIFVCIVLQYKT